MTQKLMVFLTIWLAFALNFAQAQTKFKLTGQVNNTARQTVSFAGLSLHQLPDSVLIKTAISDTTGVFRFENLKAGNYYFKLTAIGYVTYKSDLITLNETNPTINLGNIILNPDSKSVKEVTVTAKKAFVVHKQDRTVVNVDALITGAGSTALDILEKSPGVQVDQNGGISLKGKQGVTIFIDDKPTYLSGDDLANYLKSLPSSTLDQIELMTNPPAKYDAAGNAGIINIKTKRNNIKGFNGSLNLGGGQGRMTRLNNSLNLNYRNNKLSIFGNLSHNLNNSFTDLDLNRMYKNADNTPKSYFEQNSYFDRHGNTFNLKAGADYYASEKTTWGIVLTGMARKSLQDNDNTSNLYNAARVPDSIIVAKNLDDINFKNGGVNLNYRTDFNKNGHGLTADADFLTYRNITIQDYSNTSYFPDHTLKFKDVLNGHLPNNIDIYSVKTDYTLPLPKDWKLSAGLKSSFTNTDNIADYTYTTGNVTRPDYDKSNHFLYRENINAAYISFSREAGKLSFQGGLRVENTISNGHQLGNVMKADSAFRKNYTSVFPTLYLNYKFDSLAVNQIGINYGRRIDRPYYQDLNPFYYPLDKFTYYSGNPFLKPSFVQSVELSYTYKNKITTTFAYSRAKDEVNETIEIANGIYYSRPGNLGTKTVKSIAIDAGIDVAKWFKLHGYTEFANISTNSDFYTGKLITSGNYWYISLVNNFSFGKGWDGEINGNYRTKLIDAQFEMQKLWGVNAGIQKKLSAATTLKLTFNDIFKTRVNVGQINNLASTDANWTNKYDSRSLVFSLSYRFGKAFTSKQHDASGADDEKNRVKN